MASNIEVTIDVPKQQGQRQEAQAQSDKESQDLSQQHRQEEPQSQQRQEPPPSEQQQTMRHHQEFKQQEPQRPPQSRQQEEEFRYYGHQRHVESPGRYQYQQYQAAPSHQRHEPTPKTPSNSRQFDEYEEQRRLLDQERQYMYPPERYVPQGDRYIVDPTVVYREPYKTVERQQPYDLRQGERRSHQDEGQRYEGEFRREEMHKEPKLPSPPHPHEQVVYVPVPDSQYRHQQQQQQRRSSELSQQQYSPRSDVSRRSADYPPTTHSGAMSRYSTATETEERGRYSSFDQTETVEKQRVTMTRGPGYAADAEKQQPIRTKRGSSLDASKVAHRLGGSLRVSPERIGVVIAGWPNELAIQCAKACVKRGYRMLPVGICMNESEDDRVDITDVGTIVLYRYGDSQLRTRLSEQLNIAVEKLDLFPVIVDTSLHVDNLKLYHQFKVPFVFETPADNLEEHQRAVRETEDAKCFAIISQRMDKHVAAVDALIEDMSRRFPGLFADPIQTADPGRGPSFELTFKTSEPEDKINRNVLYAMGDLLNQDVHMGKVQKIGSSDETEHHGLVSQPQTTKAQHVRRVYELKARSGGCVFQFEQNVNATYECAEGVADSITFIAQRSQDTARPKVYSIHDVAQSSRFLTW